MVVKSIPWPIKQIKQMFDNTKTLRLDHPLQRGDVWTKKKKEKLIRSIFIDLPILPILTVKELYKDKGDNEAKINYVIDGKQRLTSILQFINDEISIAPNTIYVDPGEAKYNISGKKFSELSEEIQSVFMNTGLKMSQISEYTVDELEEVIIAYNNGTAMNAKQSFKLQIGLAKTLDLLTFITESDFFQFLHTTMTKAQFDSNEDLMILVRALTLFSDLEYKAFEMDEQILFTKEGNYEIYKEDVMKASKALLSAVQKNSICDNKKEWTYYFKRLPYLIYLAKFVDLDILSSKLCNEEIKSFLPINLRLRDLSVFNQTFEEKVREMVF